ncbi:MAG: tRNA (adenosine(37)-N6)-dimethylallyltransferase MiaA [Candidatus Omnitrophica bacterium]|nr:tRNA (adenosine(37)-N6)-dimethylallyltransferase MiaA [Candidatus Omnitrophota bacterium]
MTQKSFLLLLYGPTAVGKSDLALEIAEKTGAEILSADSMQVYRGLDIGSAKPSLEERERVRHHLIDVADPTEDFSVGNFCDKAWPIVDRADRERKPLIICGGTGLYVKSLIDGLAEVPPPDPAFRAEMEKEAEAIGSVTLHKRLAGLDPISASRIHPHDLKRIIRALEIHHATGVTKTEFESRQQAPVWKDRVQWIGLKRDWEDLDERINGRVNRMFEEGLVKEVQGLLARGCTPNHAAMKGLGYRETIDYLQGIETLDRTIEIIQRNTRRFARRQIGWFRNDERMRWVEIGEDSTLGSILNEVDLTQ